MSFTQYASGRTKLPFSNSNISLTNNGNLNVTGTYYLSIQGQNRVGLNLNSDLISVTLTSTSKITITLPSILISEDWQNIIISASTTNDVESLVQIVKVDKTDFTLPLELSSIEIFKLTATERTVSNPSLLPNVNINGLIRYVNNLNYYYEYNKYSDKEVDNISVLNSTLGRWIRIGTITRYQENTTYPGGCDQDARSDNLNPIVPEYTLDGSKGESVIYWIRNDFDQIIPSGTRISGIVRIFGEDKSQLFDKLILLESIGYINLTTLNLNVNGATDEIEYSPYFTELILKEDLEPNNAIAVSVSPRFRPEHLNNNVAYLANLEIYLTFAPTSGAYAPGSQALGNLIYNLNDKFRILPNNNLTLTKSKGSGLILNYELFNISSSVITGLISNTDNQYVYLTSNGGAFISTDSTITNSVIRARISTLNGISNPISYGNINLDNTKQLKINIDYSTLVRSDYPDIEIAGKETNTFNATNLIIYIKNSTNNYFIAEKTITPNSDSDEFLFTANDFNTSTLNSNSNDFGLYNPENVTLSTNNLISGFTTDTYEVLIAYEYINTCTLIDNNFTDFTIVSSDISDLFDSSSSWGKAIFSVNSLKQLSLNKVSNYQIRYVYEKNSLYQYDPNVVAPNDNDLVIKLTENGNNPGAFIRITSTTWLYGNGIPNNTLGRQFDLYLNTINSDVYSKINNNTWNLIASLKGIKGDTGDKGDKGDTGDKGDKGDKGDTGNAATITIGTVSTGIPGSNVSITNTGNSNDAILNFTIPRGNTGNQGANGIDGIDGINGIDGVDGVDGINSFTNLTANFIQPNLNNTVTITVENTSFLVSNIIIYIENTGYYKVVSITNSTQLVIENIGDTLISTGTTITLNKKIIISGLKGSTGATGNTGSVTSSVGSIVFDEISTTPSSATNKISIYNESNKIKTIDETGQILEIGSRSIPNKLFLISYLN